MDRTILVGNDDGSAQATGVHLARSLNSIIGPLIVAIAYFIGAEAAFAVGTLSDRIFAPFWPPNIILLCALVRTPVRLWWVYILAVLPPHVVAEIGVGMPLAQNLVAFATNCMVALLSAAGLRRFLNEPSWFGTLRNAGIYILITAGASPAVAALGGAFVQILGGGSIAKYWTYWGNWFISNALGSVTLGPVFLTWFASSSEKRWSFSRYHVEGFVMAGGLVAACMIAFDGGARILGSGFWPALLYLPLPFILWAAIRFGVRGSSSAILAVVVVSIWQNQGSTLFVGGGSRTSVLALQVFLFAVAVPVFLLGAAIDELRRSGEATRKLAGALLGAQDEERRRIARDLHDTTGQNLVVANLMANRLQSTAPPSCAASIAELKEVLDRATVEVRTVSYLLHPPLLDARGLGLALRSYVEGFSRRSGISVDLELPPNLGRMSSAVELALFRVIQEALTNVSRHSGSTAARIRLALQESQGRPQLVLTVEDSGKGIPHPVRLSTLSPGESSLEGAPGLGLAGMRERLHQIGGRLEIDSMSGKTVIRAIVTLDEGANQE